MEITVATIQMESFDEYSLNHKQAESFIFEAIKRDAKLIILPEMAICGYSFSDDIWDEAEPLEGKTIGWIRDICNKFNVYIGTCILECDGKEFYDTFILCGPNHKLWSHRKVEPAGYEGFFFKGAGINESVFDTPIGRIGVIICFDTTKSYIVEDLLNKKPELLIIPFAAMGMPSSFPEKPRKNWEATYYSIPKVFSNIFHVPVISSNKTGTFTSPMPMGFGMKYEADYFDESCIVDQTGEVLSTVKGKTGIALAAIKIGSVNNQTNVELEKKWFLGVSQFTKNMSECTKNIGRIRYNISRKRKNAIKHIQEKYPDKFA